MNKRTPIVLVVVLALVSVSGLAASTTTVTVNSQNGLEQTGQQAQCPADDTIGCVNGYWYNDTIDVNQSDGLTDQELEAYISRSMARVEHLRQLPFREDVPVETMTRQEFMEQHANGSGTSASASTWNNEVWKALFVVGDNANVTKKLDELRGQAVLGFYSPSENRIVVIAENPGQPVIENATLVHELTHALQDQHFDLTAQRFQTRTQDAQLGQNGLIEGGAKYVELEYVNRCDSGQWQCIETPGDGNEGEEGGQQLPDFNIGLYVSIYQPYSDGPHYVNELRQRGDWQLVNDQFEDPPNSTRQIIHPDQYDDPPGGMTFEDRARNGWSTFPQQGIDGAESVGESSVFVMFWYQAFAHDINVVSMQDFFDTGEYSTYNYTSPYSTGWENDRLVPYQRDGETGYVWQLEWQSKQDAKQFVNGYTQLLNGHDAEQRTDNTWVISDSGFSGAYRVHQNGSTVTIVHAPTVGALDDLRPGISNNSTAQIAPMNRLVERGVA